MAGKNNNWGGKRANSGRKSWVDEEIRAAVVNKSWEVLKEALDDKRISKWQKRRIALEIAKKSMPTQIEGSVNVSKLDDILDECEKSNKK